jgi:hypothetical protein
MYRPPTRRAFLSPGDALEVRTRVSVADCRDVAPDQLRYEKLQYCTVHFCCSLKLYLSPGFTYRLFPPASPLQHHPPLDPCPHPPSFNTVLSVSLSCPVRLISEPRLSYWRRSSSPAVRLSTVAAKGPSADQPRATCRLWAPFLTFCFLPSRSAFISISTAHALRRSRAAPLSARRGSQLGVQLLAWDSQSGQHGGHSYCTASRE